jgi:hypothetical protein
VFSANEAMDTDTKELQDALESPTGAVHFSKGRAGASGLIDFYAAHVLIRGPDDIECVSTPVLESKLVTQETVEDLLSL